MLVNSRTIRTSENERLWLVKYFEIIIMTTTKTKVKNHLGVRSIEIPTFNKERNLFYFE